MSFINKAQLFYPVKKGEKPLFYKLYSYSLVKRIPCKGLPKISWNNDKDHCKYVELPLIL